MSATSLVTPETNLLLTTSGLATEEIRDHTTEWLHDLRHDVGGAVIRIATVMDGSRIIRHSKGLGGRGSLAHARDAIVSTFWSKAYLQYALGPNIAIKQVDLGSDKAGLEESIDATDILLWPGGTPDLLARALRQKPDVTEKIRDKISLQGMPTIAESAGSMVLGNELLNLPPSAPVLREGQPYYGIGIVGADVLVHAAVGGICEKLSVSARWYHPVLAMNGIIGNAMMASVETSLTDQEKHVTADPHSSTMILPTAGAALFNAGEVSYLGGAKLVDPG